MIRVLLVSSSPDLISTVEFATSGTLETMDAEPFPSSPEELFSPFVGQPLPEVVVLDPDGHLDLALDLAANLDQRFGVSVVLLTPDNSAATGLAAMRAGVRDILPPDAPLTDMRHALDRAGDVARARAFALQASGHMPQPPRTGTGRIITVASPKGGVGKTTVATNLAVGLAQRVPQQTVLVDLDIHFGDIASALNITPHATLPDAAHGPTSLDSMALKTFLTSHETGLLVIPGSDSPAASDTVTPKDISRLLEMLASQFAFVVVDTAPGLSEHTLAVLDQTSDLVLVTGLDVPGIRGLRRELDTLNELGMAPGSRHVVLNFADNSRGLTVKDVEAVINVGVDITIPLSPVVPISVNQGIPLLQTGGRDPVTRQLRALVDQIAPETAEPTRGGLFASRRRVRTVSA